MFLFFNNVSYFCFLSRVYAGVTHMRRPKSGAKVLLFFDIRKILWRKSQK